MNSNTLKIVGMLVAFAAIVIAGLLVANDRPGWGWFLFVAVLIAGGIFS